MKSHRLKHVARLLTILLTASLAFGQKFQDVTAKGAPVSLSVKHDQPDVGPYAAVRNLSDKNILAMTAVVRTTDERGQTAPCFSMMDYAFKSGVLAPQEDRLACLIDPAELGAKVKEVVAAVTFVQFDDGTTWGDPEAGRELLAGRPQKLAFLQHLVDTYYERGEDAFVAALNEPKFRSPAYMVAGCLKSDAEYEKMAVIDLAKKRLAAAQSWRALGIF